MNRWGIPEWLEHEVRQRDRACVYCRVPMFESPLADGSRKSVATWEHIINDARIVTPENIARCCISCNSSKGTKTIAVWIESSYCKQRRISRDTVADVVTWALRQYGIDEKSERWCYCLTSHPTAQLQPSSE